MALINTPSIIFCKAFRPISHYQGNTYNKEEEALIRIETCKRWFMRCVLHAYMQTDVSMVTSQHTMKRRPQHSKPRSALF